MSVENIVGACVTVGTMLILLGLIVWVLRNPKL